MGLRKLKRKKKLKKRQANPDAANKFCAVADGHKICGRLEQAVNFYRKALESDPNHVEACNNLGNTLHLLDKLQQWYEINKE